MVGTLRRELLDRMLIMNARHLEHVLAVYARHYNAHRPHQSRQQRAPDRDEFPVQPVADLDARRIRRHPIIGGLIHEYYEAA